MAENAEQPEKMPWEGGVSKSWLGYDVDAEIPPDVMDAIKSLPITVRHKRYQVSFSHFHQSRTDGC